jgi:hypothetical protein
VHHHDELAQLLHLGERVTRAELRLKDFVGQLLEQATRVGRVRTDIPLGELTEYCIAALSASAHLRSRAAVRRLVAVTLGGLAPRH